MKIKGKVLPVQHLEQSLAQESAQCSLLVFINYYHYLINPFSLSVHKKDALRHQDLILLQNLVEDWSDSNTVINQQRYQEGFTS